MNARDSEKTCFFETLESLAAAPVTVLSTDQIAGHAFTAHVHESGQLIHAISGLMVVRSDVGSWVVPIGRAVWVPGGIRHEVEVISDAEIRTVFIAPDARSDLPSQCKVLTVTPLLRELIVTASFMDAANRHGEREARIFGLILDELTLARELLLHLPMPRLPALARLCRAFVAQPAAEVMLEQWATQANMHPRTFARAFTRETGMTHGAWCRHARLLLSLQQLARGISILDVALNHGYESPSAFSAMFRKAMGVSPSEYFK